MGSGSLLPPALLLLLLSPLPSARAAPAARVVLPGLEERLFPQVRDHFSFETCGNETFPQRYLVSEELGSNLQGESKDGLGNSNRREHCLAWYPPAAASQLHWVFRYCSSPSHHLLLCSLFNTCAKLCFTRHESVEQFNPKIQTHQ